MSGDELRRWPCGMFAVVMLRQHNLEETVKWLT